MNELNTQEQVDTKTSVWKRFEKFSGIIGLLSAIIAIIAFYYQIDNKESKVAFQIISKDYLTSNNNIEGLKSNYEYGGIPVKNLWLLKFRIINSGDVTLIGTGTNKSILDSSIVFKFKNNIQILDKLNIEHNNFPDHQMLRLDSNTLSISFQQWRKSEYVIYSIYVKSNVDTANFLPSSKRIIKDGDIVINDLTNNQGKLKQPLLDSIVPQSWTFICRILGVLLALAFFLFFNWGILFEEFPSWFKIIKWRRKNYSKYKELLKSDTFLNTESYFDSLFTKDEFIIKKQEYINDPLKISQLASFWDEFGEKVPYSYNTTKSWKHFFLFLILLLLVYASSISVVLGLVIK